MEISRKARSELYLIVFLGVCFFFIYLLIFGSGGCLRLRESRAELHRLQQQNLKLRQTRWELDRSINRLEKDNQEVERVAREQYNFARPGDIIVNVPE